jgi:DNA-binding PadR family transcriptional regulator
MDARADVERHLPLKPVVFHVLLALAEADAHGYGVILAVREKSAGQVRLETGAFYRHLKKLIDAGWVAESDRRPADADARRGTYYCLAPSGREVLAAESRRLSDLVEATRSMGLLSEGPAS